MEARASLAHAFEDTLRLSPGGRRKIRVCCDELNMLVPLCHAKSDKVTTLQLTTAYLRYIHKTHGDTFREVPLFVFVLT